MTKLLRAVIVIGVLVVCGSLVMRLVVRLSKGRPLAAIDRSASREIQYAKHHGIVYLNHIGKTISVSGVIDSFTDGFWDNTLHVVLPKTVQQISFDCLLHDDFVSHAKRLPRGAAVTVRGHLGGAPTHSILFLHNCQIDHPAL